MLHTSGLLSVTPVTPAATSLRFSHHTEPAGKPKEAATADNPAASVTPKKLLAAAAGPRKKEGKEPAKPVAVPPQFAPLTLKAPSVAELPRFEPKTTGAELPKFELPLPKAPPAAAEPPKFELPKSEPLKFDLHLPKPAEAFMLALPTTESPAQPPAVALATTKSAAEAPKFDLQLKPLAVPNVEGPKFEVQKAAALPGFSLPVAPTFGVPAKSPEADTLAEPPKPAFVGFADFGAKREGEKQAEPPKPAFAGFAGFSAKPQGEPATNLFAGAADKEKAGTPLFSQTATKDTDKHDEKLTVGLFPPPKAATEPALALNLFAAAPKPEGAPAALFEPPKQPSAATNLFPKDDSKGLGNLPAPKPATDNGTSKDGHEKQSANMADVFVQKPTESSLLFGAKPAEGSLGKLPAPLFTIPGAKSSEAPVAPLFGAQPAAAASVLFAGPKPAAADTAKAPAPAFPAFAPLPATLKPAEPEGMDDTTHAAHAAPPALAPAPASAPTPTPTSTPFPFTAPFAIPTGAQLTAASASVPAFGVTTTLAAANSAPFPPAFGAPSTAPAPTSGSNLFSMFGKAPTATAASLFAAQGAPGSTPAMPMFGVPPGGVAFAPGGGQSTGFSAGVVRKPKKKCRR
eukprot:TRINITY_DN675_c0_g2_i3.p1 TRINITY_DN675_c0_g2~~TRINITY_DN675_c0_g2_i3.p1  ORF type:complete len:629 (-),score=140.12 TRINITY_DN675_c0_g2_i3:133-2019(-)